MSSSSLPPLPPKKKKPSLSSPSGWPTRACPTTFHHRTKKSPISRSSLSPSTNCRRQRMKPNRLKSKSRARRRNSPEFESSDCNIFVLLVSLFLRKYYFCIFLWTNLSLIGGDENILETKIIFKFDSLFILAVAAILIRIRCRHRIYTKNIFSFFPAAIFRLFRPHTTSFFQHISKIMKTDLLWFTDLIRPCLIKIDRNIFDCCHCHNLFDLSILGANFYRGLSSRLESSSSFLLKNVSKTFIRKTHWILLSKIYASCLQWFLFNFERLLPIKSLKDWTLEQ